MKKDLEKLGGLKYEGIKFTTSAHTLTDKELHPFSSIELFTTDGKNDLQLEGILKMVDVAEWSENVLNSIQQMISTEFLGNLQAHRRLLTDQKAIEQFDLVYERFVQIKTVINK